MQIKDLAPEYGIALAVALSVWFFKYLPISNWFILPIQIVVGVVVFFVLCKVTNIEEYKEIKGMVMPFVKKLKSR